MNLYFRGMTNKDLDEAHFIECASFQYPCTREEIAEMSEQRRNVAWVFYDTDCDNLVAGFVIFEALKTQLVILDLAVMPDYRRMGVASMMLDAVRRTMTESKRKAIRVEVRDTNLAAQLFLKKNGFTATELQHGAYGNCEDDLIVMKFRAQRTAKVTR